MKKLSHKTVFIFLGILVLIFVLVFGIKYWQSQYSFVELDKVGNSEYIPELEKEVSDDIELNLKDTEIERQEGIVELTQEEKEEQVFQKTMTIMVPSQSIDLFTEYNPQNPFAIILVEKEIPKTTAVLDAVYKEVFKKNFSGISYEKVILKDGFATLFLTGQWRPAGIGSQPTFRDIITKAAFQFDNIKKLEVYINNEKWDWCIDSEKDGPCDPMYWVATESLFGF